MLSHATRFHCLFACFSLIAFSCCCHFRCAGCHNTLSGLLHFSAFLLLSGFASRFRLSRFAFLFAAAFRGSIFFSPLPSPLLLPLFFFRQLLAIVSRLFAGLPCALPPPQAFLAAWYARCSSPPAGAMSRQGDRRQPRQRHVCRATACLRRFAALARLPVVTSRRRICLPPLETVRHTRTMFHRYRRAFIDT